MKISFLRCIAYSVVGIASAVEPTAETLRSQDALPKTSDSLNSNRHPQGADAIWSRTYRDAYRLQESFANRYPGTPEQALDAFRKDLYNAKVLVQDEIRMELRADGRGLILEYAEEVDPAKYEPLVVFLARSGYWDVRQRLADIAVEMSRVRLYDGILDTNPDDPDAVIRWSRDRIDIPATQLNEQIFKVAQIEKTLSGLNSGLPQEIFWCIGTLKLNDPVLNRQSEKLRDAAIERERVALEVNGNQDDARLKAAKEKEQAVAESMKESLAKIKENLTALAEIERRTLDSLRKISSEGDLERIKADQRKNPYRQVKAKYLRMKHIADLAGIKLR